VPSQTDEKKLREKLLAWNAILVANSARFEADHPEMATIEIVNMLSNQPNNTSKDNSQPLKEERLVEPSFEVVNQPLESFTEPAKISLDKGCEQVIEGTPKEHLILTLMREGWHFRLKTINNKSYLCARTFKEERSLGLFDEETKHIVEKHNLKVNGFNENQQD
ncbi:MAG: hypothetical protein LBQ98_08395, partial [Nitrososphaerota archaeon]|nr:hypothetical protein [Nitrososphaerota archaeon]